MSKTVSLTIEDNGGAPCDSDSPRSVAHRGSAFDLVASTPWAIQPAMLETISAIARRENDSPEALEARLGRPLQNARAVTMRGSVALVPVTGPVFRYANLFTEVSGGTSLGVLAQDFTTALEDPAVSAIVLNIDSPGGQANGIAEFAQMVRAATTKPVVAYVAGMAASAAYWIAAAAPGGVRISKTAEVGSIGAVVAIDPGKSSAGVVEIVSSQSPKKRADVTTADGRSQIQTRIDNLAQVFVEDVATYRGVSVDTVLADFGQGDMRMGAEAVALGMADRVATLEEVIAELNSAKTVRTTTATFNAKGPVMQNLKELRAAYPELCAELVEETRAAELARIHDVEAQALPGHEELIAQLKADGISTGPMAAVAVLNAERAANARRAKDIIADAPAPVAHAAAPAGAAAAGADESATPEARARAEWDKNPALRAEFSNNIAPFLAYSLAQAAGRVKVLSK